MQTKLLEPEVMEAQGYKAAAGVADELRSTLEGSRRVGTLKPADSDALGDAFNTVAQVWQQGHNHCVSFNH